MFTFLTSKAGKFKICQIYQEQNPHGGNFHFCLLFLSELFQCHFNCTVPNEINFPRYSMKCSGKKRDTTRNILCSIIFSTTYVISRKKNWITFRTVYCYRSSSNFGLVNNTVLKSSSFPEIYYRV